MHACVHVCALVQVESDLYVLDYDPCVISCVQAFAASLSSFEAKFLI